MPSQYDELDGRLTAVEQEVRLAREDAAAARVLASAADRDVSLFGAKLDAHTKVLSALRETQLEQSQRLDEQSQRLDEHGQRLISLEGRIDRLERKVDDGFARIDQEFALVNQGFAKVEDQFVMLGAGMAHITTLLERIAESE
jgi:chromosome segregation ATPase